MYCINLFNLKECTPWWYWAFMYNAKMTRAWISYKYFNINLTLGHLITMSIIQMLGQNFRLIYNKYSSPQASKIFLITPLTIDHQPPRSAVLGSHLDRAFWKYNEQIEVYRNSTMSMKYPNTILLATNPQSTMSKTLGQNQYDHHD